MGTAARSSNRTPFAALALPPTLALIALLGSSGCSGMLLLPENDCVNVTCETGERCVDGACVVITTCNPFDWSGDCAPGSECVAGACYVAGTQPPACTAQSGGWCADGGTCVDGECVQIPDAEVCSASVPDGKCTGTDVCVEGWCYASPEPCSLGVPNGYCDGTAKCVSGTCVYEIPTCSATNPDGSCESWQACVDGTCIGPVPPRACSATSPTGICPTSEVCVAGTCTPLVDGNTCSPTNLTGLCAAGASCVGGTCIAITALNGCSSLHPDGICSGGATCVSGTCQQVACISGGYACDAGTWCVAGGCIPLPCDPVHPAGVCADTTLACDQGLCVTPPCSIDNPTGACPDGLVCRDGSCEVAPCSTTAPNGYCPNGDICDAGVCIEGPCAADNLNGTCTGQVYTDNPTLGRTTLDFVCCDGSALSGTSCTLGTCTMPLCSTAEPRGVCPDGQYCDAGSCIEAPCSPFFQSGTCTDPAQSCVYGRCLVAGCISQPANFCDPDVCDTVLDACVSAPCDATHPNGYCPIGQTCVSGACAIPDCSPTYPGGACTGVDAGKLCVGGTCITPPCSSTYPTGDCGANFVCNNGTCELAACSDTAPLGFCATGERCVGPSPYACVTYACSTTFPTGPCPTGYLCDSSSGTPLCTVPPCSTTYPGGACASNEVCVGGTCVPQPCSTSYPSGACGAGFTCVSGICQAAECSPTYPTGACTGLNAGKVCLSGACVDYVCGTNFPSGPCPVGQICDSSSGTPTCALPPCSAQYPGGVCTSPQVCVNGSCVLPACSAAVPTGQCPASQVCCSTTQVTAGLCTDGTGGTPDQTGTCVRALCDVANPNGKCDPGFVCNAGVCEATTCSTTYPYGQCVGVDAGKVCVGGTCVNPCGATNVQGWCPSGFACVEAACSFSCANDSDCDGVSDADENIAACSGAADAVTCGGVAGCLWDTNAGACLVDTDGDGSPDRYDRDSDGDLVPDAIEAGDLNIATAPVDTDGDGMPNLRDLDSDGDHISDTYEAGPAPALPRDSDGDGQDDYVDADSDNDGIYDRCEVADVAGGICNATGIVDIDLGITAVSDADGDGTADYLDTDSDNDGVTDSVEARANPADAATFSPFGVDHDADGTPDYRDPDSDGDGVADADEDVNGDGVVNCQVDGTGAVVNDTRATPACGAAIPYATAPFAPSYPYDYNPGCIATGQKCLLAESSRIHPDTDGDGIPDGQDGVFLVCSTANLKPINLFYSQHADFAFALEQSYTQARKVLRGGADAGMLFDDPNTQNGSYAVPAFVLQRTPSAAAIGTTNLDPARELIDKALAQEVGDRTAMTAATGVSTMSLVINRNFTSFDGYGALVSRYRIITSAAVSTARLRDDLVRGLDGSLDVFTTTDGGPTSNDFTLLTETLYRWDDGATNGSVFVIGALVPTSSPIAQSYEYRGACAAPTTVNHITAADPWTYFVGTASSPANDASGNDWRAVAYNDTAWASGLSRIGYDTDGNVEVPITTNIGGTASTNRSLFVRRTFNVTDAGASLSLTIDYDDGFVAYLNGKEVARRNLNGTPPAFDARASTNHHAGTAETIALDPADLVVGANVLAIQINRRETNTDSTSDLSIWATLDGVTCGGVQAGYQIPLFFADNITSGSALAQFGDDVNSLCQSLVQANGQLDFLWVIDNSGSMGQEISQVEIASKLFVGLINNTEADYRIAQTTSAPNNTAQNNWPPLYNFDTAVDRLDGYLTGDFTGAIAGQVDPLSPDRSVTYDCATGCFNGSTTCCPDCPGIVTTDDPACYFASRLPNTSGSGSEWTLLMGEWAMYRAGAPLVCEAAATSGDCNVMPGCWWSGTMCVSGHCAVPASGTFDAEQCNGADNNTDGSAAPALDYPYGADDKEDELEPASCEWNPAAMACWPSFAYPCTASPDATACAAAGARCAWSGTACVPTSLAGSVLCNATNATDCSAVSNGWCVWDTTTSTCSAPAKKAFRQQAEKFAVILTDEEDCYLKDLNGDAVCPYQNYGDYYTYSDPIRLTRESAYLKAYQARDFTVFAITGDKPDPALAPNGPPSTSTWNGGCSSANGQAEPGMTVIRVAEGTGGGWGSICALNLYPSIESIVINALAKSSPYRLEGFIGGHAVQPIAATIKVAVEVCNVVPEYPTCASGTHMQVVPRSRENGFDYDSSSNALVLYGSARPVVGGDIVVSYRYWIDNMQPPQGNPACPCPETTAPSCACGPGLACGVQSGVDLCAPQTTQVTCEATAGCSWNTVLGCVPNGLCEPDPTCGGGCTTGQVCDPTTGLCVCDISCGGGCGAGQSCDSNLASPSCGSCLCDTTCGGGCPAGQLCDSTLGSPTCGSCSCDTTCGGCASGLLCDSNPASPSCGFCQPPQCGSCTAGQVCDTASGLCVCDTTCGGGCPIGTTCDTNSASGTCGQCLCDTTCGGTCPSGQVCDTNTASATCGLCQADPTCGVGGNCNVDCTSGVDATSCNALTGCRWGSWLNGGAGGCAPTACEVCNPTIGLCVADTACCGACGPTESCNTLTGQCECDTTCAYACAPGLTCDANTGSATCGQCLCDTTCGGSCPTGLICDDNAACAGFTTDVTCGAQSGCTWNPSTSECLSASCGRCVVDPTCGGCPPGQVCNTSTGLCELVCPTCARGTVCDTTTGTCICDQTCGGACPLGSQCDGDPASASCGQCVCDTTCGGAACPGCSTCDTSAASSTCGLCIVDTTCGGACGAGTVCDSLTGCCVTDTLCGGFCPTGYACDPLTGQCVYVGVSG